MNVHFLWKPKMKMAAASRTAQWNALFRALETGGPRGRLINDPLARRFLTGPLRAVGWGARIPGLAPVLGAIVDVVQPGVRPTVVARTRLIDEYMRKAMFDGIAQVVILGAGFDTRAWRIAGATRIFEVDHPNTSAAKQRQLRNAKSLAPVRYVKVDFNHDELGKMLAVAGYDPIRPTFFLWEGVTNYLTEAAVRQTFAFIGKSAPNSRIAFTYVHRDIITHPQRFAAGLQLERRLAKMEEPFTFGLDPGELTDFLRPYGLTVIEDIGSVDYRIRYLGTRGRHLRGHEFYRVAVAEIGELGHSKGQPEAS
jgi:methyltransferase (TIGR00027 family)